MSDLNVGIYIIMLCEPIALDRGWQLIRYVIIIYYYYTLFGGYQTNKNEKIVSFRDYRPGSI